eukprot:CAMPEP_0168475222 /NCGR_PEP_ID=MMETSP0228-20121227/61249_1 /TAXON_ID=133427 /ORGANISM="Protoceratium reticulatum, Strain CCCM 535 (=CCMP 1889)" /LENGTH=265 /DNA_ID=CAMNT_0008491281 /DNA_START=287 /DNA_END=1081 /DNA_ORIENTATION=-
MFACNEYVVYSNVTIDLWPGAQTSVVAVSLQCKYGGEFKTALNLDIFIAVWKKVVAESRYQLYDWTVKVDADAVFLPGRLRALLAGHKEDPQGVYLSNCRLGMHGPLEVLSRNAVTVWYWGVQRCQKHFTKLCSGDCEWGEDLFLDQCLSKVLLVKQLTAYSMLVEDHCEPAKAWENCLNKTAVAFHPFKKPAKYAACLARAQTVTYVRTPLAPAPSTTAPPAAGAPAAGPAPSPGQPAAKAKGGCTKQGQDPNSGAAKECCSGL